MNEDHTKLDEWPRNSKDHDTGQLSQSIQQFGYTNPVLVDERYGHTPTPGTMTHNSYETGMV